MTSDYEVGMMLRGATTGFVVGCRVSKLDGPYFGALVRAPAGPGYTVYGLIHDIRIDDDGLVRQLVTSESIDPSIIEDNRLNRNIPLEISVLAVGYREKDRIFHLLPPRPPLSLDRIFLCDPAEICAFTGAGRFGYFRLILRSADLPVGELISAHLLQAQSAHAANGHLEWSQLAMQELITLLRDDYPTLMSVLSALSDAFPGA
jgi:hypothetical protein